MRRLPGLRSAIASRLAQLSLTAVHLLPSFDAIPPPAVSCGRRLSAVVKPKRLEPDRYYADALGDVVTGVAGGKRRLPRSVGGDGGCLLPVVQIQTGIRTFVTVDKGQQCRCSRRNRESNEGKWIIRAKGASGDTALLNGGRGSLRNGGTIIRRSGRRRVADDRRSGIREARGGRGLGARALIYDPNSGRPGSGGHTARHKGEQERRRARGLVGTDHVPVQVLQIARCGTTIGGRACREGTNQVPRVSR